MIITIMKISIIKNTMKLVQWNKSQSKYFLPNYFSTLDTWSNIHQIIPSISLASIHKKVTLCVEIIPLKIVCIYVSWCQESATQCGSSKKLSPSGCIKCALQNIVIMNTINLMNCLPLLNFIKIFILCKRRLFAFFAQGWSGCDLEQLFWLYAFQLGEKNKQKLLPPDL